MTPDGRMEPVPATAEFFHDMRQHHQGGLVATVMAAARRAESIVPDLVGMSVGLVADDVTFALTATEGTVASQDAVQYVEWCVSLEAAKAREPVEVSRENLLDEHTWLMEAQASAAAGIASSLCLPILEGGEVVGSVSLYASTSEAFEGRHETLAEALAEALGSSVEAAVRNADLPFHTRGLAEESAARHQAEVGVELAVGILMARHGLSSGDARARLRDEATYSGISESQAASVIRASRTVTGPVTRPATGADGGGDTGPPAAPAGAP